MSILSALATTIAVVAIMAVFLFIMYIAAVSMADGKHRCPRCGSDDLDLELEEHMPLSGCRCWTWKCRRCNKEFKTAG
jgi:transposase-like protein